MATVIVNGARAIYTNLVSGLGGTAPNYWGIGSGSTAASATDTALTTEYTTGTWTGYARKNAAPTRTTVTLTNDTISWSNSWTAGASQTVAETGAFDAATSGNMLLHSVFSGVALSSGDSISIAGTLQFT